MTSAYFADCLCSRLVQILAKRLVRVTLRLAVGGYLSDLLSVPSRSLVVGIKHRASCRAPQVLGAGVIHDSNLWTSYLKGKGKENEME